MKNLFVPRLFAFSLVVFIASLFMISCSSDENKYETRYSADGKDSVVYVHYRDNGGQYHDFFINYLMFRTLFGNGGYNGYAACHNYYNNNPAPRINTYHTYVTRTDRSNSYSGSSGSSSTSSGSSGSSGSSSKSWWGSGSKSSSSSSNSYSSPSRSSSSYSSPSRSYSSPSRSYSSPSRSYSSPSRSYSSPSRH